MRLPRGLLRSPGAGGGGGGHGGRLGGGENLPAEPGLARGRVPPEIFDLDLTANLEVQDGGVRHLPAAQLAVGQEHLLSI